MPDGADKKSEATPASQAAETSPTPGAASRRSLRLLVGGAIAVIAVLFGGREMYQRINFVYAEDSRIEADLITVSSRVAGWVTTLDVTEGAPISKGQVLLNIDARESTLRVAELDAQVAGLDAERERLAAERRMVDAQTASMYLSEKSQLEAARVTVSSLQPELKLAKEEYQRAKSLFEGKASSRRELDQSESAHRKIEREHQIALANLIAAKAKLAEAGAERTQLAVLDGEIAILTHRRAELLTQLEKQKLDLTDRTIRSSITGVVDKTFVKIGEYVTPGQRLALVHDPKKIWIEANIKETQIRDLKLGQTVEVGVDAYPDIPFTGRVLSIGNATTSEFALLPSPNPSGNFTKITQRLPVRIAIDQQDDLLRPGMMVEVNIDIRNP
ncbi:MAG: HlyD family secretion protein [Alphaproteobacteria bacterium]|jgi:membrane fusion protein, multidrug efflux system|nr:HlyD family secretion protein [Alphaproteobacteria bacterium]